MKLARWRYLKKLKKRQMQSIAKRRSSAILAMKQDIAIKDELDESSSPPKHTLFRINGDSSLQADLSDDKLISLKLKPKLIQSEEDKKTSTP